MNTVRSEVLGSKRELRLFFLDVYDDAVSGLSTTVFDHNSEIGDIKVAVFNAVKAKLLTQGCAVKTWLLDTLKSMHTHWVVLLKMLMAASETEESVVTDLTSKQIDELSYVQTGKLELVTAKREHKERARVGALPTAEERAAGRQELAARTADDWVYFAFVMVRPLLN